MKTQYLLLTFFSLFLTGTEHLNYHTSKESADYGKWEMVKNSQGVQTFVRWVANTEGVKRRERMGEMIVDCPVEVVISVITDAKSSSSWMSSVKESHDLKRVNTFEWYTYTLFNIPWPFENRDLVSNNTMKTNTGNDSTNINIISREDYIPIKSGVTRLTDYTATWGIVRIGKEKVRITFTAITNTPPMFPRWIQDPVLENMFHNNLVNLKAYILLNK